MKDGQPFKVSIRARMAILPGQKILPVKDGKTIVGPKDLENLKQLISRGCLDAGRLSYLTGIPKSKTYYYVKKAKKTPKQKRPLLKK